MYLPESFEWMILDAGVLKSKDIKDILDEPSEYVESRLYFSWERFFTAILVDKTKDTYLAYIKRKLNPAYLNDSIRDSILKQMKMVKFNKIDNS